MPQRKSAKKYLRQNKKRRLKNLQTRQNIRTAVKKFKKALESANASEKEQALKDVYKTFDKAATKKLIHKNTAARKKSRLSKLLKKTKKK